MAVATDILTAGCALVDRSERGKLALTGAERKEFLQGQVTNDVEGLEPGSGCYAAFLTHKGKMLGDLRILDTGDELLLDCERSVLQDLFTMIRRFKLGRDVELHKRTLERGLLSLIGPGACAPPARWRWKRRRPSCAAWRPAGPATASTSTTPSSPRRRASTSAPSPSPRAATWGRRPSPGSSTAASRTATCAGSGSALWWSRESRCGWASARWAGSAPSPT